MTQTSYEIIKTDEKFVTLSSQSISTYWYKINLRNEIPKEYDIIEGMDFEFPEHLDYMFLEIGGHRIKIDKDDFKKEISTLPLYLSEAKCAEFHLVLVYDKAWIESQEEYVYEDEYKEIEEIDEDEHCTVFDGYYYHTGVVVHTNIVPTGKQVKKIIKGVDVVIPNLILKVVKQAPTNLPFEMPFRYKIDLKKIREDNRVKNLIYEDYKQRLVENYGLVEIDEDTGYITNKLRYISGLAGLMYTF